MNEPVPSSPATPWYMTLVERAKAIILTPKSEWEKIDGEPAQIRDLFVYYVLPLAAIGPVANLLGGQIFGRGLSALGVVYRPSIVNAVSAALVTYVFAVIAVGVLAFVINALAKQFQGTPDQTQAVKVAVYASTAGWLAGIFNLVPALAVLGLLGLYNLYLLYTGLPRLMKAPEDKALTYVIVVVVVAVVVWLVAGALAGAVTTGLVVWR